MTHPAIHPLTLRALYALSMGSAFLRFGNPRRREADRHRVAFYDRAWREAAADRISSQHSDMSMRCKMIAAKQRRN